MSFFKVTNWFVLVVFFMFVQMAFGKRKKVTAAEGSSSARFDRKRFVGPAQEARYQELETRVIFPERRIVPSAE